MPENRRGISEQSAVSSEQSIVAATNPQDPTLLTAYYSLTPGASCTGFADFSARPVSAPVGRNGGNSLSLTVKIDGLG